jgi:phosphoglycerate dehydrogenase-like enzyme
VPLRVLVPLQSQVFFAQNKALDAQPLFYRLRQEPFLKRGMRKLGLREDAATLDTKFEVVQGEEFLPETYAIWLSAAVRLSSLQMALLLDRMPQLRWVYSQITGTDHLDLSLFAKRGVAVSNSGRLSSRRMAEMALALIFAHAKSLPEHFALQRNRRWRALPCEELSRQTVGIVGTGSIGTELAKLCRGVGLRVIGASRNPAKFAAGAEPFHEIVRLDSELDRLLAESDHVVLALPLNKQTHELFDAKRLSRMKPNSSLINLARGALVNEDALCDALAKGTLGAAYVDLPAKFPPPLWSRLYRTPNLMLTHNSAAKSERLAEEAFHQFLDGLNAMLVSGNPPDRVI